MLKSSLLRLLVEEMSLDSEPPSPKCMKRENYGGSQNIPPEILALGELEFKKAFLLLSYIPGYFYACKFSIYFM